MLIIICAQKVEIIEDQIEAEVEVNHTISPAFRKVSNSMKEYITTALGGSFGSYWKGLRWSQSQADTEIKVHIFVIDTI